MMRRPLLASLALGALSALGFAPLDLWPVTLACLSVWLWLVHDAPTMRQALLRGWLFGVGHFTIGNNWIQHAFTFQDAMPHALGYVAVALLALYLAIYPMAAAALAWRFASPRTIGDTSTPPGGAYVLVFAAAWIVTEWLRGTMFTGFAWNPIGVIWLPLIGVAHGARWIGSYGLSGITILVSGALFLLRLRQFRLAAPVLIVVALLALSGLGRVLAPPTDPRAPRIRVVQPDLAEEERPTIDYPENNLRALAALSGRPGPAPRLIVWPEGALRYQLEDGYPAGYYWREDAAFTRRRIATLLGPRDVVLTGGSASLFDRNGEMNAATNAVFAIDKPARIRGRYDKAHLVPFGEYLPLRPLLSVIGLSRLVPGDIDFISGPGPRNLMLPGFGLVGVQICYEIVFSGHVTDPAHRPAFIFNPSNDSWFGNWGPPQHLAQARLRAIEEAIPIIRATPTGISAIIDADGALLATIPPDTAGAIETPIPAPQPPTMFARVGNLMAFLLAGAMLLIAIAIRRRSRYGA